MRVSLKDKYQVSPDFSGATRQIVVSFIYGDANELLNEVKSELRKIFSSSSMKFVRSPKTFSKLYTNLNATKNKVLDNERKIMQWIRYFFRECVEILGNDLEELFKQQGNSVVYFKINGHAFSWEPLSPNTLKYKKSDYHKVLTGKLKESLTYKVFYRRGKNDVSFIVGFSGLGSDVYKKIIVHEFEINRLPKRPIIIPINVACNYILDIFKNAVEDFANSDKIKSGEYFFRFKLPSYIPNKIIEVA